MPHRIWWISTAYLLAGLIVASVRADVAPPPAAAESPVSEAADGEAAQDIVQRLQGLDAATREELVRYLQEGLPPAPSPLTPPADKTATTLDPALVAQGQAAFESYCVDCHDAERSLNKRKSFSGWLSTTKRMAAKADAGIPSSAVTPIATYLASVASAGDGGGGVVESAQALMEGSSFSTNATISTMWRGADQHDVLSPGFFADVWIGADWQPDGPVSATVMACTSCHSDFNLSKGYSVELVDGSATLDLLKLVDSDRKAGRSADCTTDPCGDCPAGEWNAKVKAGRFVVPFGAFQAMSHPGVYRTVDNPLIFDMGRRYSPVIGVRYLPVVAAPYSDEGVNLDLGAPLAGDFAAGLSLYAVNGFQGDLSWSPGDGRAYYDNNRSPAGGARLTVGNSSIKFGTSWMAGQMQDDGADDRLYYHCYGTDLIYRHEDLLRLYFEYAARQSDFKLRNDPEYFKGVVAEGEVRIVKEPRIGLLARYDTLDQHRYIIFPDSSIQRYTYGLTVALPGPTSLMVNHEIWKSADFGTFHLLGVRWVASF
ncbi:MAG: hypothetical protein SH850_05930 [Planctomycetaceae bacterium]|nr:hypothetical protein [Planctomycetaceae bacterium]